MLKDLEGSGSGLFEVVSRQFSGGTEDNHNENVRRVSDIRDSNRMTLGYKKRYRFANLLT
jgi:hypothetical protein